MEIHGKLRAKAKENNGRNMSFAPWEEGFRPPNDDPYDDGPYLDPKGRVIPRKYGTKGKSQDSKQKFGKEE